MVTVKSGRFGIYINWNKVNAKMPSEYLDDPSELPLEEAWSLIQEKAGSTSAKSANSKKGKKKSSSVELPPAPKRSLSAYLFFCAEKRPEVSTTAKSLGSISKELARLWAETSDDDRKPYNALAQVAKEEYAEKKKTWLVDCQELLDKTNKSQPSRAKGTRSSTSKSTSKSAPKRPKSAYVFFCSSKRAEVSKEFITLGPISKELARLWSETIESERKEFKKMADEDKLRYEKEKLDAGPTETTGKKGRVSSKKKESTKKKRGPSAYMLFCAAHRNDIVDENGRRLPLGETTKRLAQMWKECDDEARSGFLVDAAKEKELV
jgi:hypothetical protein